MSPDARKRETAPATREHSGAAPEEMESKPGEQLADDLIARASEAKNEDEGVARPPCSTLDEANQRLGQCLGDERDAKLAAGLVLDEIEAGLYRDRFDTFDDWIKSDECPLSKTTVFARRRAAAVLQVLEEAGVERLPTFSHYVALAEACPEDRWAAVAREVSTVPARQVKQFVRKRFPSPSDDVPPELRRLERIVRDCERLPVPKAAQALADLPPSSRDRLVSGIRTAATVVRDLYSAVLEESQKPAAEGGGARAA